VLCDEALSGQATVRNGVRVIGNESVHPGQIDISDDPRYHRQAIELVNLIADAMIN